MSEGWRKELGGGKRGSQDEKSRARHAAAAGQRHSTSNIAIARRLNYGAYQGASDLTGWLVRSSVNGNDMEADRKQKQGARAGTEGTCSHTTLAVGSE